MRTAAAAQTPPPPAPLNHSIRVTTSEVTVPVTVTTRHGELVLDLSQTDFHVFDDGVEQKINRWELGGDPLAIALVIDTDSHLHPLASSIHSMGIIFTDAVMALHSEAAVLTYDSSVTIRQPFTLNRDAVEKAIENSKFDGSEADLYDGMAAAVRLLQAQPAKWRRIMLIVGESQDSGSMAALGQVVRNAEQADITIYVVGASSVGADLRGNKLTVHPLKLRGLPPITATPCNAAVPAYGDSQCFDLATPAFWLLERGTNALKHHELAVAAAATGGADFSGFRESALQGALDRIGGELHAQYILGFRPSSDSPAGLHSLRVTIDRPGMIVRARPGYFLARP
jgi:VWFA-related protein